MTPRLRTGGAHGGGGVEGGGGCCFWWVAGVGHTQTPTRPHPRPGLETRKPLTKGSSPHSINVPTTKKRVPGRPRGCHGARWGEDQGWW